MGSFSILPDSYSGLETWLVRIFFICGLITIGPWAALLIYDVLLYCFRWIAYEIPILGGRARGRQRPRAPSLTERPSGHRRRFSLARPGVEDGLAISTGRTGRRRSNLEERHRDPTIPEDE
ncbi:hypothetical protein M501DRAFT_924835 [Patellaria atrata CBS 101060]|uniref:Uncharacterized protein n=1 Tax=Patellaria atrata CBS 101060 TaxID=1346257 RepID=A0A9P4SIA2_9PEZI|nr:hypothetical protein M501DRAFT_924835 [Patellaria atrata CBS 101060]